MDAHQAAPSPTPIPVSTVGSAYSPPLRHPLADLRPLAGLMLASGLVMVVLVCGVLRFLGVL